MDQRLPQHLAGNDNATAVRGMADNGPPADWKSRRLSRLDRLHAYWQDRRGARALPLRRDIDPGDLKDLLPYIIIAELHRDPLRIRYRLGGTAVNTALGYNIAGHWLHEMEVAGGPATWMAIYRRVAETLRPVFGRSSGTLSGVTMFSCDFAVFPMSHSGDTVDQCLEIENWETEKASAHYGDDRLEWSVTVFP
jgi:hypothetical protein